MTGRICPSLPLSELLMTTCRMKNRLATQKGGPLVVGADLDLLRLHRLPTAIVGSVLVPNSMRLCSG
jgi:hypothetical protein